MAGRGKKIPVVDVVSGRCFDSAEDVAKLLGMTRQGVVAYLRRENSKPLKGHTFVYAYQLEEKP